MLEQLLGLSEGREITYVEGYLRSGWPTTALLLALLAVVVFVVLMYRRAGTMGRFGRAALGSMRVVVLGLLILMLFEPMLGAEMNVTLRRMVLMLVDRSASMQIRDAREETADLREAALATGRLSYERPDAPLPMDAQAAVSTIARIDLARAALGNEQLNLVGRIEENHRLRAFTFGEQVAGLGEQEGELLPTIEAIEADAEVTRLGAAIEEVVSRFAGQPIAGVVLLSDGGSNQGIDPIEVAGRLREREIPLYPVGVGLPDPPDIAVKRVILQDIVFPQDTVPMRVQIRSTGYEGQPIQMTVRLDGRRIGEKQVVLESGVQFVELAFVPGEEHTGRRQVDIELTRMPNETSTENNFARQAIRVIDEKIKVLYIEGKPRWEFRYLRGVLLRDDRLEVKFIMTEGDADLARYSPDHLASFPTGAAQAFEYDLVLIGDVPSWYFTKPQLERIEQLVRERSGSLLMLAGSQYNPSSYRGTVLEPLLPVRLPERGSPSEPVGDTVHPVVSEAGERSSIVRLDADPDVNAELWARVRPIAHVPRVREAKPGATVLMELSDTEARRRPYPLIAWQRYGSGKCLFVGTDSLWRLRFKRGDTLHARFWAQSIQFLTLSRLLSGSNRITIETDRSHYRTGQRVSVFANVLDEAWEPVEAGEYTVYLERANAPGASEALELSAVPDTPGLFQGYYAVEEAGHYTVRPPQADAPIANTAEFDVQRVSLEQREPAMQQAMLAKAAELSGGQYLGLADLDELPDLLQGEPRTTVRRIERSLWDLPAVYIVIVVLLGLEWALRRRANLV
jgi:hypothetical protein